MELKKKDGISIIHNFFFVTDSQTVSHHLKDGLQLPQRSPYEVFLSLRKGPDAAHEQLLRYSVEHGQLVQELGIERLVVVARGLQLVLHTAVLEAVGSLLAVVVVQQLVEALLDELVRSSEHEEELGEWVDDQGLCPLLLLRRKKPRGLVKT